MPRARTEQSSILCSTSGGQPAPWYRIPISSVPRGTLVQLIKQYYTRIHDSSTAIQHYHDRDAAEVVYNNFCRKWKADPDRYPSVLPGFSAEYIPSRIEFFRKIEVVLTRSNTTLEQHCEVVCACNNAIQQLIWRELPSVKSEKWANTILMEGHDASCVEIAGPEWTPHSTDPAVVSGHGALGRLRRVVGRSFVHRSITYTVKACLTATEDVEPVYELRDADGQKKYVSFTELQEMIGIEID